MLNTWHTEYLFGTVWLNRAFQIEPDLFSVTLMDGVVVSYLYSELVNGCLMEAGDRAQWVWPFGVQKVGH